MRVAVVGGGASGMAAAIAAAERGASAEILERADRVGRKLLKTGNGKCNLGNRALAPEKYHSEDMERMRGFLERFGTADTERFFRGLGVLLTERSGCLYPYSGQAATVLDALRFRCAELGVRVRCGVRVTEVNPIGDLRADVASCTKAAGIELRYETEGPGGEPVPGTTLYDRVILASGGMTPFGSLKYGKVDYGNSFELARYAGHTVREPVPALCPLYCAGDLKRISGVRARARVVLLYEGTVLAEDTGELQFTDYGVSGIPVFQISGAASRVCNRKRTRKRSVDGRRGGSWTPRETTGLSVLIDLLPECPEGELAAIRAYRDAEFSGRTAFEYFSGILNNKLIRHFLFLAGIREDEPVAGLLRERGAQSGGRETDDSMSRLDRAWSLCQSYTLPVTGTAGFEHAQIASGGVPLSEVSDTLESVRIPGLYLTGELLDVDGLCGGYNLQWAWCSGRLAGSAAGNRAS